MDGELTFSSAHPPVAASLLPAATAQAQESPVSFASSYDAKQQVKEAVDIVDLTSSYLQLRREGRGYKALCPWHNDQRPSLQINPERQSFKCWVCDIGGDVFSFIMKMEGVEFPEALKMLADRAGVSLQQSRSEGPGPSDVKRTLYQAMAWAEQQYQQCLLESPAAEIARRYLDDRGVTEASIEKFHLGFAPDEWDWIQKRAAGTPHQKALETVGLVGRTQNGKLYDRFKGRVLFSIRDSQSRPIALGGRVMPQLARPDTAKYINSPETPLFSKSNQLYGLDLAREPIRKTSTVLVMEGYTDCIMAHQFGCGNAVAVLGTALGDRHIRLLQRFAEQVRIVLVLDGDEAGKRRANEILQLFIAENVDLRVLTLPNNLDPCDFLLEHGAQRLTELVGTSNDALSHAVSVATADLDLNRDVQRASHALEELMGMIATAPRLRSDSTTEHRLREEKFLGRLSFDFRVPEEKLRDRLRELRSNPTRRTPDRQETPQPRRSEKVDSLELALLECLIQQPGCITEFLSVVPIEELQSAACREIYIRCMDLHVAGVEADFDRLLLEFDDPYLKNLLVQCDEQARVKAETVRNKSEYDCARVVRDLIETFRRRQEDRQRVTQTAALKERRMDSATGDEFLKRILEQERSRQGISVPTDG